MPTCHISIDVDGRAVDGMISHILPQCGAVGGVIDGTHPLQQVQSELLAEVHSSPGFPQPHLLNGLIHILVFNLPSNSKHNNMGLHVNSQ